MIPDLLVPRTNQLEKEMGETSYICQKHLFANSKKFLPSKVFGIDISTPILRNMLAYSVARSF